MTEWIDRQAVLEWLGIKPQTLYAYVSRGQIGMQPDPADPRRSLYRAADVQALKTRRSRGRRATSIAASALRWGEPALQTAISTVHHGRLLYRGQDAVALSEHGTCEEIAAVLWERSNPIAFPDSGPMDEHPFAALATLALHAHPALGRSVAALHTDAALAIGRLATSLGAAPGEAPLHDRLAQGWALGQHQDIIRMALILIADHELNASSFATRVAASTGASIPACLLAGLATLSGPRHGGAANAAMALLAEARRTSAGKALTRQLGTGQPLPGFGHPLYPMGDPRAVALCAVLPPDAVISQVWRDGEALTGTQPNIDFALAALALSGQFPPDAPFRLFTLGRSLGWVAHAVEQVTTGSLIRPRGIYTGRLPADEPVSGRSRDH